MSGVTHSRLLEVVGYEPETGDFIWLIDRQRSRIGDKAGCLDDGYLKVNIDGRTYKAHRLAWFYVYGEWPAQFIDHKDQVRSNNRIANLREATRSLNSQNQRVAHANNASCGLLGVTRHASGRWSAKVRLAGKCYSAGLHDEPIAAHEAYVRLKRRLHEGCTL